MTFMVGQGHQHWRDITDSK